MPRFVDKLNATFVPLGDCQCPHAEGQPVPHPDGDWAKVRTRMSYGEKLELSERINQGLTAGLIWNLQIGIVEWNFVDEKGEKVEITEKVLYELDEDTADALHKAMQPPEKKTEGDGSGPKAGAKRPRRR